MPPLEFVVSLLAAVEIHEPLVPLWAMESAFDVFLGTWLFFVGASVGSFLNVVVYRLPRGINLVYPGSRCPSCLHPIRLRDNVPVLSWALLGGRCRDCQAPVSSRYFWIELLMGCVFLVVWLLESPPPESAPWCAYGLHVLLIATILGGALIHADRFATPPLLFVPILLAGIVLPLFWSEIRRFPAWPHHFNSAWQAGAADGIAGVVTGVLLAVTASSFRVLSGRGWPNFAPVALMAAAGAVLGWQLMLWATPAIVVVYLAAALALWLLGPLPSVPVEAPSVDRLPEAAAAREPAASSDLDSSAEAIEPPLSVNSSDRDLPP
jgi:leader peptidase (prepilin peptidase)/N-methyltransferase